MIRLSNGHEMDFCVASGALGFDGRGWWFERPWRWAGLIRPGEFTIITKTLTAAPRQGNLKMWCPWRCVRPIRGGWVNAVGLTNPGIQWWREVVYPEVRRRGYDVIVSIAPEDHRQAEMMIDALDDLKIVGIELNVSCPNTSHDASLDHVVSLGASVVRWSRHPVVLKLSYDQPWLDIVRTLDGAVEAFDLINTVPWRTVYGDRPSPLAGYGLSGGVSGRPIRGYAREALAQWSAARKLRRMKTPVISGGGIDSYAEVSRRAALGASAFSFGTVFITRPWAPNRIASQCRKKYGQPSAA